MGEPLPTVAIKWHGDTGFLTINKSEFNPAVHELYDGELPAPVPVEESVKRVDINTASLSELIALPSIGGAKANKLIANRPLLSIEDALDKTGIDLTAIAELIEFGDVQKKETEEA